MGLATRPMGRRSGRCRAAPSDFGPTCRPTSTSVQRAERSGATDILVVYGSQFGNTERLGRVIGAALEPRLVVPPESFLVAGFTGPLVEGEEERAKSWALGVVDRLAVATA
jgi:hypothetical protein